MKKSLLVTLSSAMAISGVLLFNHNTEEITTKQLKIQKPVLTKVFSERKKKVKGLMSFDKPDMFEKFHAEIRTEKGKNLPDYKPNYTFSEYKKAVKAAGLSKKNSNVVWTERGPGNASGRTRGLIVDVIDKTNNTWFAGASGGGIWKTTDAGKTWSEKTFDNLNLAVTTIAQSKSTPDIMFAGTGEGFGGAGTIKGNGIFKSSNHGETWVQLASTAGKSDFSYINRLVLHPTNDKIILAATNTAIMKSVDGGNNWTKVYTGKGRIQQILASPASFDTLYASENSKAILKSTDGGNTWIQKNTGIEMKSGSFVVKRMELAISPSDSKVIYIAQEMTDSQNKKSPKSVLYKSINAGENWAKIEFATNEPNWLKKQGWYNNTLAVHPSNNNIVYLGGIDFWVTEINGKRITKVEGNNISSFLKPHNWGLPYWKGGISDGSKGLGTTNITKDDFVSVEIKFGPGKKQKAHVFKFTNGYPFTQLVEVPFEVWDTDNNKQLAVSIIDKNLDKKFTLSSNSDYIQVHAINYNANGSEELKKSKKHKVIYFIGPELAASSWTPDNLPESSLKIIYGPANDNKANALKLTDWDADITASNYAHADHHNIIIAKTGADSFRIIDGNDGGIAYSDDKGQTWRQPTNGYNSTQFYGVDKHPTKDEYIGGTQDNGTFLSQPGVNANKTTSYKEVLGGDGFIGTWNIHNDKMIMGALYTNRLYRSVDGGKTWKSSSNGFSDWNSGKNSPFITTIGKSKIDGYFLIAVSKSGVWRSVDFGASWKLAKMDSYWYGSTFHNPVEISIADQRIVWAGGWNGYIQVSTDGALTFKRVKKYSAVPGNKLTGLVSHPTDPQTAFMLFSQSGKPKIVRTTDLGKTWKDLSGFEGNSKSSNGFPNVAVYDLLVMPYNTNIYWACTEIGIFVSEDAGGNWTYMNNPNFPAVSVWETGIVGSQVVFATHGRGIWTATIPELNNYSHPVKPLFPVLSGVSYSTETHIVKLNVSLRSDYDSTLIKFDDKIVKTLKSTTKKDTVVSVLITENQTVDVSIHSYKDGELYQSSSTKDQSFYIISNPIVKYINDFETNNNHFVGNFTIAKLKGFRNGAMHSQHNYSNKKNHIFMFTKPVIVQSSNATLSYKDIAIVEIGNKGSKYGDPKFWDYVIVEASKDGKTWFALLDGYDANADASWLKVFKDLKNNPVDSTLFKTHTINLLANKNISAGDQIFIRFRLYADGSTNSWGWVIDDLKIQETYVSTSNLASVPDTYKLGQNYPNPFNPSTTIKFALPTTSKVKLTIYNTLGKEVEVLVNKKEMDAGYHTITWDASKYASGVYFYTLVTKDFVKTKKLMFIK